MTGTIDHRQAAQAHIRSLISVIEHQQPPGDHKTTLLEECEALARAIGAFHLEGIRFRSYNVDRLLHRGTTPVPVDALDAFAEVRKALEAAGFHTRSHQS